MSLLDADTPATVRLSAEEAEALAGQALRRIGLSAEDASVTAAHLVDAALCGYGYAGLPRILALAAAPEMKEPHRAPSITHETPISALVDGGNSLGYVAVRWATDVLMAKAAASGIAVVGLNNAWNSGRAGYYAEAIARAGYVAIHTVGTPALVAPRGAARRALGTNPLAIGLPDTPNPLVLDMSTGAAAWADVVAKAAAGESYAGEIGIDSTGHPTSKPAEILTGGLWPFGGHKGFGLSVVIQALGLLAGSRRRRGDVVDFGYLLVAFRPDLLMPRAEFEAGLAELLGRMRSLPQAGEAPPIRIPSERAFAEREIRRREGIVLDRDLHARLAAL